MEATVLYKNHKISNHLSIPLLFDYSYYNEWEDRSVLPMHIIKGK